MSEFVGGADVQQMRIIALVMITVLRLPVDSVEKHYLVLPRFSGHTERGYDAQLVFFRQDSCP
jgi:hypothetical protein